MRIYLDNAASTPTDKEVVEHMLPWLNEYTGNPSSIHTYGRQMKVAIEKSRKTIASLLQTSPSEIFFTSGGTEADNTALVSTVLTHSIKHIITSPLEHHAVLHTAEFIAKMGWAEVHLAEVDALGNINEEHLEALMKSYPGALVSLMHANNELGNLYPILEWAEKAAHYQCIFHSDTVQTMGHFSFDLSASKINMLSASAHKFHGPKGVGFIYINKEKSILPFVHGGGQERNMRGGTENVASIMGMAKAMELAQSNLHAHKNHITSIKQKMIDTLKSKIPGIGFNGLSADMDKSLYTILNIALPPGDDYEMLLFDLDINKIAASAGSACASGTNIGSHVLQAIHAAEDRGHIRFSFSKYNTFEEIDLTVDILHALIQKYIPAG